MAPLSRWLFNPSGLTPHGFCLLWNPGLIWTHALADLATGAAYAVISIALVVFVRRRGDLVLPHLFLLFAAFILFCGITHWLDVLTLWVPAYGVQGVAKALTATVSIGAAVVLWRLLPVALALPSPAQLRDANTALRKSEAFLSRVGRVAGIGGWEVDLATGAAHWSVETYRLYGVPPSYEPSLASGLAFYPPQAREVITAAFERAARGGAGWDLELPFISGDGRPMWVRTVGAAECDDGKPVRIVGAILDVTDRKSEQSAAIDREVALFRNSSDALSVAYVEDTEGDTTITYEAVSPAFAALTGIPAEQAVGHRLEAGLPADMAPAVIESYHDCLKRRKTIAFATNGTTPLGRRDVEGSLTPVEHPSTGSIVRVVGAMRDVTERNLMEASLRHSQKLEAVGRLSAGVAHDFNNILQTIVSGLELVLDEVRPDGPAHEFATIAIDSAMRGASLTQHLLSYARKQMLRPQAVDLAFFVSELQSLMVRTLGPQIVIHAHVENMAPVLADPAQLQTALLNLAINASHAMPRGGTLDLAAHAEIEAGEARGVILVSDTGVGMDAATLAHAADPFFTTKGADGSGLGLSMVQGFAAQSGGTFRITSMPGHGTTVELRLPLAAAADTQVQQARMARATGSGRILLVDDSTDVLVTAGAVLEKAGFVVVRAESGEKALARLDKGEMFDAMITDYAMPGLNGADLIARTRRILPGLRTLLITGYAGVLHAEKLPEGTLVLRKPFQRDELIESLNIVLESA